MSVRAGRVVKALLAANETVTALVGTRIWPVKPTQGKTRSSATGYADPQPCIRYWRSGKDTSSRGLDGSVSIERSQYLVEYQAATESDLEALGDAIEAAMDDAEGAVAGELLEGCFQLDRSEAQPEDDDAIYHGQQLYTLIF